MRTLITILLVTLYVSGAYSQDYLGIWSYDKLKESAIPEDASPESIAMLSNIFGSLKLDLREDLTYTVELMGQGEDNTYKITDDVLVLSERSSFQLIDKNHALFKDGNAQIILKRGESLNQAKTYIHLTQDSYNPIEYDANDLIGKWTTLEVKGAEGEESPETIEAIMSSLSLTFQTDGKLEFNVLGINQERTWEKGKPKGLLVLGAEKPEPKEYLVHRLTNDALILELKSTGTLVYLTKKKED
jgi:hypothetical protein